MWPIRRGCSHWRAPEAEGQGVQSRLVCRKQVLMQLAHKHRYSLHMSRLTSMPAMAELRHLGVNSCAAGLHSVHAKTNQEIYVSCSGARPQATINSPKFVKLKHLPTQPQAAAMLRLRRCRERRPLPAARSRTTRCRRAKVFGGIRERNSQVECAAMHEYGFKVRLLPSLDLRPGANQAGQSDGR